MQTYAPAKPVAVEFTLRDAAGDLLSPAALRARVMDEDETVLQDWAAVTLPAAGAETVSVAVLGALNILTPPARSGARVVELQVDLAEGSTVTLTETYLLQGGSALVFGANTFLTYAQAVLLAAEFVPMAIPGWGAATREDQEKALATAHERILRLPLGVHFDRGQSSLTQDAEYTRLFGPSLLRDLSPGQVAALYPPLLQSLKRAQLLEADEILNGDPVRTARQNGLLSNTVGESSQFFRTAKPLDFPVGPRAIEMLQRWIRIGAQVGRR